MAVITAEMVAHLRAQTDEPMMECKKALTMTEGDFDAALKWLKETPFCIRRMGTLTKRRCEHCGR